MKRAKTATAERDRHEALVASARQNKAMADQQRELLRRLVTELGRSAAGRARLDGIAVQRRAELAGFQTMLERREEIEIAYREWTTADAGYAILQERAEAHAAVVRQMHPIEMAIARAETQLEQRVKELEGQEEQAARAAADAVNLTTRVELEARLAELQTQHTGFTEQERAWQEAQNQLQEIDLTRRLWEQERVQLDACAGRSRRSSSNAINLKQPFGCGRSTCRADEHADGSGDEAGAVGRIAVERSRIETEQKGLS